MKIAQLEFDIRKTNTYVTDLIEDYYETSEVKDYTVTLNFDMLETLTIDENLNICTIETIRGKNKTFNAYLKPVEITLSGKFSDNISTIIQISEDNNESYEYFSINSLVGKEKSKKLNELFTSLIEDTRLLNIKTFYKTYKNYVLTNFNLSYISNNTINVELTLQEIMLRYFEPIENSSVPYQMYTMLSREEYLRLEYITSKLLEGQKSFTEEEIQAYINEVINNG